MNAEGIGLYNGRPAAHVPLDSRGLAYGDGLFETLLVLAGEAVWLAEHLARMERGCTALGLRMPRAELRDDVDRACRSVAAHERAVLKIVLTRRSEGRRGYRPLTDACDRIVTAAPAAPDADVQRRDGVRVRLCRQRLSSNPALAGIKHLNRLEQVLARGEWRDEFAEGLMLDEGGRLVEGTMSNLFLVRDGELLTPPLDRCGVAGIVRAKVMDCWRDREQREPVVSPVSLSDLYTAAEVFLTNSLIGIWPVVAVDCHRKQVGPATRELQRTFKDYWHV